MKPSEFWSLGDYSVVGDLWSAPGQDLAAGLQVRGLDVIDLATGTGVTAIAAAQHGAASITGIDITPSLLEEAERRARRAGVDVRWFEADVMSVPLPDDAADLVVSTFGLVFANDPRRSLLEARRLARPGGRVVFTSWSPNGLFGDIRAVMADFFPEAPVPWHETEQGIREVAGSEAEVDERRFDLVVDSPDHFVALMERYSAPIVIATEALGHRWPAARAALLDAVRAAGSGERPFRVAVPYWITTLHV